MGSFATNSGSIATTSAEGSDDECIENYGKHFDAGVFHSFSAPLLQYSLRLDARFLRFCCMVSLFPRDCVVHDLSTPFLLRRCCCSV